MYGKQSSFVYVFNCHIFRLVQVLGCSMDSKYSKLINSPPSYHSPKPSLRTHLSLNFSET